MMRFLFETILQWTPEDIKQKLTTTTFKNYRLYGMLETVFHNSVFEALNTAYPGQFREWELRQVPKSFWNEKTKAAAIRWLIAEKLQWTEEEVKEKFKANVLNESGLARLIDTGEENVLFKMLNNAFPGKYKEWELKCTPKNFWTPETGVKAVRWLIEEKLKIEPAEIPRKISVNVFTKNKLRGCLRILYNDSPY